MRQRMVGIFVDIQRVEQFQWDVTDMAIVVSTGILTMVTEGTMMDTVVLITTTMIVLGVVGVSARGT